MIKIAIDAMGGDFAPQTIVEGVNKSIAKNDDLELVLYGVPEEINKYLVPSDRVSIVSALTKLDMGEKNPILAIRRDKELSLSKAFQAVHDKVCDGVVTAGPTQGVVVAAHMIIKKIPGMDRIALCPTLPKMGTKTKLLLDVGANVELKAEHVMEMAKFASVYAELVLGRENPLVGLVN
ncbi:MAG: phosphate acyltransferase, partial [Bacilli bacterium]